MAYVAVAKALYDYEAQDPETELSLKEDQILYVIEKEDDDWWKAKLKDEGGAEGTVGLIPRTYVEEIPPMNQIRSIYAYDATSPEELSMEEDAILQVFSAEDDWLLVRIHGGAETLGFVPRTYCEPLDAAAEVEVPDAAQAAEEVESARREEEAAARQREVAERQRQLKLKDKVETWGISEMDGKKKKKGTLGVGNGAVFFASDTDKMTPVKQYPITELSHVSQPSSKNIELSFSSLGEPLLFHCGNADTASAILAKLESSKEAAGEALQVLEADNEVVSEEEEPPAPVESKAVRFAAPGPAPKANGSTSTATVLYDFDAQGDDELTVAENEIVTVVDKENDEWWLVRNTGGKDGVVPAQYVQLDDGSSHAAVAHDEEDTEADEARRAEEEAAAAAALEAERQRDAQRKAEQRRAIEKAAREKQQQEEEDRQYALQVEQKEIAKRERRVRREAEESARHREEEARRRREEARGLEPPKITKRPSAQNVAAAAASLPSRGRVAPERPPENHRPKPNPGRIRTWSDKTGQFKVEAEYLGLNGNKIRLHKLNGVIIEVPIDKMSPDDYQLIRRHEARKARARQEAMQDDDDVPLGNKAPPRSAPPRSTETRARAVEEPIPPEAMEMPKPRKPRYDWFEFFLNAGCDIDDCTRYAANFERDRIDEAILPDLDSSTLRSLGLKEGDVIRVAKTIRTKFAEKTPEQSAQIKQDEEYARQLQEHINSGSKGPAPQPPPSLFTSADGKLANNTRRGRPEKKSTGPESVDAAALLAATDQLSKTSVSSPTPPPVTVSPPPAPAPEPEKPKPLISGFDDDAWTIKPSSSKPASPAPPVKSPVANTTEALLAQIQSMKPTNTGASGNNSVSNAEATFERLAQMRSQPTGVPQQPQPQQFQPQQFQPQMQSPQQTGSSFSGPSSYGMGLQGTGQPMSQMMMQPTGARGPLAPVPANEGLLNPLQPNQTGMFVPTRAGSQSPGMMMAQPTGYAQGFQQGYGAQPQMLAPSYTGFPGAGFQQPQSAFNAIASIPPPQPQQNPDKFAPSNIFAAMKQTDFTKDEQERPQQANKYDSLRPLTTGYNGPPQQMMPQQTGYGMMPQMTGYNPQMGMGQMGYMGQQNPYGYR